MLATTNPRRLHSEEIKALEAIPAAERPRWARKWFAEDPLIVLFLLLVSIASWIEAQEAFAMWLAVKRNRAAWRGKDPNARERAFQAQILAQLPERTITTKSRTRRQYTGARVWEGLGIAVDRQGVPWTRQQWANILKQAARSAKKALSDCTRLEEWVWWCYPIFSRYGWSAREVKNSAAERGLLDANKGEADFRRYWITRGLRFAGRRTERSNPPLAEFVRNLSIPALDDATGVVFWRAPNSLQKKIIKA